MITNWIVEKFHNDPVDVPNETTLFSTANRIDTRQITSGEWITKNIALSLLPPFTANHGTTYRYNGKVYFQAGTYTFDYWCDDGLRFYINNALVNPNTPTNTSWKVQSWTNYTATYTFTTDGYYDIRMEYFNHGGNGNFQFGWYLKNTTTQSNWAREIFHNDPVDISDEGRLFASTNRKSADIVLVIDDTLPNNSEGVGKTYRYKGKMNFPIAGDYKFTYICDDGLRFYIDDVLVNPSSPSNNSWKEQGPTVYQATHTIPIIGEHDVRVEYYNHARTGRVKFLWELVKALPVTTEPPADPPTQAPPAPTWINGVTGQTIDGNPPTDWTLSDGKWYPPIATYLNGVTHRIESGSAPVDWTRHADQYWYPPQTEDYIPNPSVDLTTMVFISPPMEAPIIRQYQKGSRRDIETQQYNITNRASDIAIKVEMYGTTGITFEPNGFDIQPLQTKQVSVKFTNDFFESLPVGTSATDMWMNLSATSLLLNNEIVAPGTAFIPTTETVTATPAPTPAPVPTPAPIYWYNGVTSARETGSPPAGWVQGQNGAWKPVSTVTTTPATVDFTFNQTGRTTEKVDGMAQLNTTGDFEGYRVNWNFDLDGVGPARMTNNNNLAPTVMWPMNATDYSNVQANGYTTRRVEVRAIHPTTGMISSVQTVQLVPDSGNQSNTTTYARPNKNNQSVENMI